MTDGKKKTKKSGFGVRTPKVGLYPAGSIIGVRDGKVVTSDANKQDRSRGAKGVVPDDSE